MAVPVSLLSLEIGPLAARGERGDFGEATNKDKKTLTQRKGRAVIVSRDNLTPIT